VTSIDDIIIVLNFCRERYYPKVGELVITPHGTGRVLDTAIKGAEDFRGDALVFIDKLKRYRRVNPKDMEPVESGGYPHTLRMKSGRSGGTCTHTHSLMMRLLTLFELPSEITTFKL
jgi:hypothetical protein